MQKIKYIEVLYFFQIERELQKIIKDGNDIIEVITSTIKKRDLMYEIIVIYKEKEQIKDEPKN